MSGSNFKEMFPDWSELSYGEWSKCGRVFRYGSGEKDFIEIGLYREPLDNDEYAGTYTLQVFDGDTVIACHTVGRKKE